METFSSKTYADAEVMRAMRVIADHMKAAVMIVADGVVPGNKTQGYVLRRLIRRSMLYGRTIGMEGDFGWVTKLVPPVIDTYRSAYPEVASKQEEVKQLLSEEANRFSKSLKIGLAEIEKVKSLDGKMAFYLYESFGFPWEMTEEIAMKRGEKIDRKQFEEEFLKHKNLSRTAAVGMFKGGLADHSEKTVRLHTAHHLLLAALQKVVDPTIKQRGSNITSERLRMDFNFSRKLTDAELASVGALVNEKIQANLPVVREEMAKDEAERIGAQMEFGLKYPDRVSVYFIGLKPGVAPNTATPADYFSAEFCGGPHVSFTGSLGHLTIAKEESAGAGVRRIYATITDEAASSHRPAHTPKA
jgi:alanyl-tRNA synthetase